MKSGVLLLIRTDEGEGADPRNRLPGPGNAAVLPAGALQGEAVLRDPPGSEGERGSSSQTLLLPDAPPHPCLCSSQPAEGTVQPYRRAQRDGEVVVLEEKEPGADRAHVKTDGAHVNAGSDAEHGEAGVSGPKEPPCQMSPHAVVETAL